MEEEKNQAGDEVSEKNISRPRFMSMNSDEDDLPQQFGLLKKRTRAYSTRIDRN